jgi:hypothetical protein
MRHTFDWLCGFVIVATCAASLLVPAHAAQAPVDAQLAACASWRGHLETRVRRLDAWNRIDEDIAEYVVVEIDAAHGRCRAADPTMAIKLFVAISNFLDRFEAPRRPPS